MGHRVCTTNIMLQRWLHTTTIMVQRVHTTNITCDKDGYMPQIWDNGYVPQRWLHTTNIMVQRVHTTNIMGQWVCTINIVTKMGTYHKYYGTKGVYHNYYVTKVGAYHKYYGT